MGCQYEHDLVLFQQQRRQVQWASAVAGTVTTSAHHPWTILCTGRSDALRWLKVMCPHVTIMNFYLAAVQTVTPTCIPSQILVVPEHEHQRAMNAFHHLMNTVPFIECWIIFVRSVSDMSVRSIFGCSMTLLYHTTLHHPDSLDLHCI